MPERPWEDAPAHYKTTDAEVLAQWDAAQQRFREFNAAQKQWSAGFPDHEAFALKNSDRVWLVGLHFSPDTESPGEGWRRTRRADFECWVPDKRTKAGKALQKTIDAIRAEHVRKIPGMPSLVVVGNRFLNCGLFVHEGIAYVNWSCSFAEVESEGEKWSDRGVDESRWERIKRSEFFAADEARRESDRVASSLTESKAS